MNSVQSLAFICLTCCSFHSIASAQAIEAKLNLEWLQGLQMVDPAGGYINPGNSILQTPQASMNSTLRPQLRLTTPSIINLVARPSFTLSLEKRRVDRVWKTETLSIRHRWNELFATANFGESVSVTYGLQNFQWGDAELTNSSNFIFRDSGLTRTSLSEVIGRNLLRVNLSKGQSWSTVLLVETEDSEQETFRAGERFEKKALLKEEWSAQDGSAYVGITAAGFENSKLAWGEYASWTLNDAIALYADLGHRRGSDAWYPKKTKIGVVAFSQTGSGSDELFTTAVIGSRLSFEEGRELRFEYLENQPGYTQTQVEKANDAYRECPPSFCERIQAAFFAPGLEFYGRRYLYLSGRYPDFGPEKKLTLMARYLHALTDNSGRLFSQLEYAITDDALVYAAAVYNNGYEGSELVRHLRSYAALGVKNVW